VVLGHVDAGKSTLMGRLLHELGAVSSKEVHKHQREAAQMGKVGAGANVWAGGGGGGGAEPLCTADIL
jgi:elongation factor 1 alpha-like protein